MSVMIRDSKRSALGLEGDGVMRSRRPDSGALSTADVMSPDSVMMIKCGGSPGVSAVLVKVSCGRVGAINEREARVHQQVIWEEDTGGLDCRTRSQRSSRRLLISSRLVRAKQNLPPVVPTGVRRLKVKVCHIKIRCQLQFPAGTLCQSDH